MKNDLASKEPLLWLAMIVGGWGGAQLAVCWWQGLIGISLSALIVYIRTQKKKQYSPELEVPPKVEDKIEG